MGTPYTKLTNLELTGLLKVAGAITASGGVASNVTGNLTGGVPAKTIEKADSYALSAADRAAVFISEKHGIEQDLHTRPGTEGRSPSCTTTARSRSLSRTWRTTRDYARDDEAILVVGSATANASTVIALN